MKNVREVCEERSARVEVCNRKESWVSRCRTKRVVIMVLERVRGCWSGSGGGGAESIFDKFS